MDVLLNVCIAEVVKLGVLNHNRENPTLDIGVITTNLSEWPVILDTSKGQTSKHYIPSTSPQMSAHHNPHSFAHQL